MTSFGLTWDYRCPFARIAHDHVVTALEGGAEWDVQFVPFSLSQVHAEQGTSVWDDPGHAASRMAMEAALVVRERMPEQFLAVHRGLFDLRHAEGGDLRNEQSVRAVLARAGVDADAVFAEIDDGWPRKLFQEEHETAVRTADVWGVPTFVVGDRAVFVRLMRGPDGDVDLARRSVERIVDMLAGWPELNEFKHTSLSH